MMQSNYVLFYMLRVPVCKIQWLGILHSREHATKELGKQFSLKDFHYQVQ